VREEARTRRPRGNAPPASTHSALKAVWRPLLTLSVKDSSAVNDFWTGQQIEASVALQELFLQEQNGAEIRQTEEVLSAPIGFVSLILTTARISDKFVDKR
jgi:hypothetical protein